MAGHAETKTACFRIARAAISFLVVQLGPCRCSHRSPPRPFLCGRQSCPGAGSGIIRAGISGQPDRLSDRKAWPVASGRRTSHTADRHARRGRLSYLHHSAPLGAIYRGGYEPDGRISRRRIPSGSEPCYSGIRPGSTVSRATKSSDSFAIRLGSSARPAHGLRGACPTFSTPPPRRSICCWFPSSSFTFSWISARGEIPLKTSSPHAFATRSGAFSMKLDESFRHTFAGSY